MEQPKKNILPQLWHIMKLRWLSILCMIGLSGSAALLSVYTAVCAKKIIDDATGGNSVGAWHSFFFLAGIVLAVVILRAASQSLSERTNAKLAMDLKRQALHVMLHSTLAAKESYADGELLTRVTSDATVVSGALVQLLPALSSTILRFFGVLAVLFTIDWRLCIVVLAVAAVMLLAAGMFRKRLKALHKLMQVKAGRLLDFLREILGNFTVVKAMRMYRYTEEEFEKRQAEHYKVRMKRKNFSIAASVGMFAAFEMGYLAALGFGAYGLFQEWLSYGSLIAILQLIPQIRMPINNLSAIMPTYYAMIASAERIFGLEEMPKEPEEAFPGAELYRNMEKIVFEKVSFCYGEKRVLKDLDCEIPKGGMTVIAGPSGIGKSTMMKLLLGLYPVDSGRIYLKLREGETELSARTRGLFSYVPQGFMLFSGSIRENLTAVRPDADEEAIRLACRLSCAEEFIRRLPDGLDSVLGAEGIGLSEGQMQRLAIARALLSPAPIVLLDEASSAVDEKTERELHENLRTLTDKTCIMISHKPLAREMGDRTIFL